MHWKPWLKDQKIFFQEAHTLPEAFRREQLHRLLQMIEGYEKDLLQALKSDLGRSDFEAAGTEVFNLQNKIRHTLKHLHSWMRPKRVGTKPFLWPARARVYPSPYGQVLILAPWNYPLLLSLSPAVAALAAGNVITLKPSELAPATSRILLDLISHHFPRELFCVVEGDHTVAEHLQEHHWDMIFLTGSPKVGVKVMEKAARHLTPVVLELGGKSPCLVDTTADIQVSARRIVWGKFTNAGQTCVAPDYVLVHRDVKEKLTAEMIKYIQQFYSTHAHLSPDYGRIISPRHFDRLVSLLSGAGQIVYGGRFDRDRRYFEPTLVDEPGFESGLMQEEIFGPILPLIGYSTLAEALSIIEQNPQPLALYCFTNDKKIYRSIRDRVSFGGGCLNDTLTHLGIANLPFGGVGNSGMGRYHGEAGFRAFSYEKGMLERPFWGDSQWRYPPYGERLGLLRQLFRYLG